MKARQFCWYLAPGFTIIQARNAFCDHGVVALEIYDEQISVRKRKGWKCVRLAIVGIREVKP